LKLDNMKKAEKERQKKIKTMEAEISRIKNYLDAPPEVKPEKLEDLLAEMVTTYSLIV
jgi:structural maintenance of chromosomes protein 5